MDWTEWIGKRVFLRLKNERVYSGVVKNVDSSAHPMIFITIKDKFEKLVTFVQYEITEIKEE